MSELLDTDRAPARDDGYVALKRRHLGDIRTPEINGHIYIFQTFANIALAWVAPEDVDAVLRIQCGCCGGRQICFTYANVADVRRWTNKGGF